MTIADGGWVQTRHARCMFARMDHSHDPIRPNDAPPPARLDSSTASIDASDDADFVRGPGRERQLKPMRENHTERFVVAPHRGAWGSGIWSVRRDGELVAVHPAQWEAMLDATERAYAEWSAHGTRALVEVQEMDGRFVEARVFGPQRLDPRVPAPVTLSEPPNPLRSRH